MKYIIAFVAMLLPLCSGAQAPPVKALSIGDTVPDIVFSHVINYKHPTATLSDFKGKLVILDFMTTGCISCIEALPRFDSLQKKYADRLQVFLITPESENRVVSFLKRKNIAALNLSIIAEDTSLSKAFPHTYISHDVFIKNAKVVAITYPEYVIEKNVVAAIENKTITLPIKRDITSFQYGKSLLHPNEKIIPDLSYPSTIWYSTLTSYMDNVPESFKTVRDSIKNIVHLSMINVPVIDLYKRMLYGVRLAPVFIRLKVAHMAIYSYDEKNGYYHDWLKKNTFCYDGKFPLSVADSIIKKRVVADLDFYLGLRGRMVKRKVWCWVITKSNDAAKVAQNNNTDDSFRDPSQNASLDDIIYFINKKYGNTPAIDLTGDGERKFPGLNWSECTNIPFLKNKLSEYGYSITLNQRIIDILEIEENEPTKL